MLAHWNILRQLSRPHTAEKSSSSECLEFMCASSKINLRAAKQQSPHLPQLPPCFFARVAYWDRLGAVFSREIFGSQSVVELRSEEKHSLIVNWEVEITALFTTANMMIFQFFGYLKT